MKPENHPLADLFRRLQEPNGWAVVEAWERDGETETNHLEFKRKTNPTVPELDADDKDNAAKGISALANTGGGILVIGVDAGGGDARGMTFDRVRAIKAIDRVEAVAGALERNLAQFTDPAILGLEVAAVKAPGATSGVVAIQVPDSPGGPHRAQRASKQVNDRYFMRTAAGSITVPHAMLGALFARSSAPRLRLGLRGLGSHRHELVVRNDGSRHVTHVSILAKFETELGKEINIDEVPQPWSAQGREDDRILFALGPSALYPQQTVPFVRFPAVPTCVVVKARAYGGTVLVDHETWFRPNFAKNELVWLDQLVPLSEKEGES